MNIRSSPPFRRRATGSALVITLVILVLITVIVVGYISSVMFETKASRASMNEEKANGMATMGLHLAIAQLRDALGTTATSGTSGGASSWDNPFGNFIGTGSTAAPVAPAFFWSVSPGLLTRWEYSSAKYSGTPTYANLPAGDKYPLFSGTSATYGGTSNLVNLNRPNFDGTYPIISGSTPVSVQWVNVLQNPSLSSTNTNQIIGRFAYWVDDENAKININTADGTNKNNTALSLGAGSPTEVSLQVLSGTSGTAITATTGSNIVQIARTTGFHSAREILRAAGTTPDLYTSNVFNLTCCSRSPELNVFGHPRIAMLQGNLQTGWSNVSPFTLNLITMQPLREIYPTTNQLPNLTLTGSFVGATGVITSKAFVTSASWPIIFGQLGTEDSCNSGVENVATNRPFTSGMLLAYYMAGLSPSDTAGFYTWPAFPGSAATTFLGKYSARQIDSIGTQICDLGAKATSSDFFENNPSSGQGGAENAFSAPTDYPGWLSCQYVSGMGRTAKVTKFLMRLTTKAAFVTGLATPKYSSPDSPPEVSISTWMEWWLPAHYQGLSLWNMATTSVSGNLVYAFTLTLGEAGNGWTGANACLNVGDQSIAGPANLSGGPKMVSGSATPGYIETASFTNSWWGSNLMTNNQGIDFTGNPFLYPDPDQPDAGQYHPYLKNASSGTYMGSYTSGSNTVSPVLNLDPISAGAGSVSQWAPGEFRATGASRAAINYLMSGSSGGGTLTIAGGLTSMSCLDSSRNGTEMDTVPLEAMRVEGEGPRDAITNPLLPAEIAGSNSSMSKVRDRLIASVVPMNGSVAIPPDPPVGTVSATTNTTYIYSSVAVDPLINKFPGDWVTTTSSTAPTTSMVLTGSNKPAIYMESSSNNPCKADPFTSWYDPDSYWMPTMDSTVYQGQTPAMPRAARFPSIGYLNYIRTGIIPDDETLPYSSRTTNNTTYCNGNSSSVQHGTPYRLLNFAPSTDPSQKTANSNSNSYPDWAMLDLMYVPSMLLCYGSPYSQYAGTVVNPSVSVTSHGENDVSVSSTNSTAVNNMFSYGTYGGATSGRMNPNGSVIYTTNVNTPATDTLGNLITRTVPLQALLHGLSVNQNLTGSGTYAWTGGTTVSDTTIASAIASYIQANGPLRMPGEICNISAVAAMAPTTANGATNGNNNGTNNPTRNDLVRQVVGNLTTQSNTFSVWVAGQSVQKVPRNTNYGQFESGDVVLADMRYHFIVERYLDPGADGVYGNLTAPGADGIVGTLDDPVDAAHHPFEPRYLYRVISAEQIR